MTIPNLYHVKYFVDAVELGSISKAASKNFVSHSAISQAISSLESLYSLELLVHKKKNFEITDAGILLKTKAKNILKSLETLGDDTHSAEISGTVNIGISRSLSKVFLIPLMNNLKKDFPKIKLNVIFGKTDFLIEEVTKGKIQLGITVGNNAMPNLKQTPIYKGHFVLVSGAKNKKTSIEGAKFLLTEPRFETELFKKKYQQQFKLSIDNINEVSSWDAIVELVKEDIGLGLVPDFFIKFKMEKSITPIHIDWFKYPYEIYLHSNKNSPDDSRAKQKVISIISKLT